jgi:ketosteroid isomerase-like protein
MTVSTPSAIQSFVDATNAEDSDAFVAAFSDDATLDDWGRVFAGRDGVARWNESDNIGKHSRFDVVEVAEGGSADEFVVTVDVTGDGFTGLGTLTFRLEAGFVRSLTIS